MKDTNTSGTFIAPDGARLAYEVHGAGPPLLLVSGQGGDRHGWDWTWPVLAREFTCITWDHRGTGESDKPQEPPYSIEGFAADGVALLDHLDVRRAHVYGVSMGGRIAQRLAISHPHRVGAVVLGCTTPGNAHGVRRPPEVDAVMANRPSDPEEMLRFLVEQLVSPGWAAAHSEYVERQRERLRHPIPGFARRLHYTASEGHEAWDELPSITAPVLVIHGDDDRINMTANAPLLAERIPRAELYVVKGGRHGYFIEFADESNAVVSTFLRRNEAALAQP